MTLLIDAVNEHNRRENVARVIKQVITFCLFFLPIAVIVIKPIADSLCVILIISSIMLARYNFEGLDRVDILFLLAFASPLIVVLIQNVFIHNIPGRYTELGIRFFLPVTLFLFVRKVQVELKWLGYGCAVALLTSCMILFVKHLEGIVQPSNDYLNSITFSSVNVAFMFLAVFLLGTIFNSIKWQGLLFFVGLLVATLIISFTLTRGVFLTLLTVSLFFLVISRLNIKIKICVFVAGFLAVLVLCLFHDAVNYRVVLMVREISDYFSDKPFYPASITYRFEMYKAALLSFTEYPVIGVGSGLYDKALIEQIASNSVENIFVFGHAHNEFLNFLAEKGALGFIAFILIYMVPFFYFMKYVHNKDFYIRAIAAAGLSVVLVFILTGVTDVLLVHAMPVTLYSLLICLFVGQVMARSYKVNSSQE